jgi:hypothetical protein
MIQDILTGLFSFLKDVASINIQLEGIEASAVTKIIKVKSASICIGGKSKRKVELSE